MLLSVIVYTTTALLLFFLANNYSKRDNVLCLSSGKHLSMGSGEMVLSFIIFCIVAGARYDVGVDYLSYLDIYLNKNFFYRDFEPGFILVTQYFQSIGAHYFFYFAFWAFLQIFFIYKSCEDEKYLLPFLALFIMLGPFFLDWMNGIRQCAVCCFFVFSIRYIEQKRILPFIIGILLSTTIHKSAFILIPFFLLSFRPIVLKNKWVNLIVILICVILGSSPTWIGITSNAPEILKFLGYDVYADSYDRIMDLETFRQTVWGPSRISLFAIDIIVILHYPMMREYYKNSRKIDILFFIFFLGCCLYNLFVNTSHIYLRLIQYFTIFKLPLTAYALFYLKKTHKIAWFMILCFLSFTYIYFVIYKSVAMPTEVLQKNLYKFFFMI